MKSTAWEFKADKQMKTKILTKRRKALAIGPEKRY